MSNKKKEIVNIVPADKDKYISMLNILHMYTPFSMLRNKELEVFAGLLKLYNEDYSSIPKESKDILLFSSEGRNIICDRLGIKRGNLDNIISSLKKTKLIIEEQGKKKINKKYLLNNVGSITFKFNQ